MQLDVHVGNEWFMLLGGLLFPLLVWAIILIIGGITVLLEKNRRDKS